MYFELTLVTTKRKLFPDPVGDSSDKMQKTCDSPSAAVQQPTSSAAIQPPAAAVRANSHTLDEMFSQNVAGTAQAKAAAPPTLFLEVAPPQTPEQQPISHASVPDVSSAAFPPTAAAVPATLGPLAQMFAQKKAEAKAKAAGADPSHLAVPPTAAASETADPSWLGVGLRDRPLRRTRTRSLLTANPSETASLEATQMMEAPPPTSAPRTEEAAAAPVIQTEASPPGTAPQSEQQGAPEFGTDAGPIAAVPMLQVPMTQILQPPAAVILEGPPNPVPHQLPTAAAPDAEMTSTSPPDPATNVADLCGKCGKVFSTCGESAKGNYCQCPRCFCLKLVTGGSDSLSLPCGHVF